MHGLLFVLALSSAAHAQVVVRDTNVVTIDRETLERYHAANVAEALRLAAGFDVVRTYFKQDVSTARGVLQEHYANDVLLMIDGMPAWMATTGEGNLDRIDIGMVERIELIRGPASVRYGTNAYAGAINIVLREPSAAEAGSRISAGTEGYFGAAARAAFRAGRWSVLVGGAADGEDGDRVRLVDERGQASLVRELHEARNVTIFARETHHTVLLNAVASTESFLGSAPEIAQGFGQDHLSRGYLASYKFHRDLSPRAHVAYRAGYDWNRRNFSRSGDGVIRSNVEGWRLQHDLSFGFRASPSLRIQAGGAYDERHSAEYTNESIRSGEVVADNNMRDRGVSERSLFAEAEWHGGPWRVSGGSRLTKNELFGSNVSSRGALAYTISPSATLQALVRESYRAPSLFELYFQTATNTVYGNTELRPETSRSFELGYAGERGALTGQIFVYRATYEDKIVRVRRLPDHPTDRSTIYRNSSEFSANGLELDLRHRIGDGGHALLTWTWTDGGLRMNFVPSHRITFGASFSPRPDVELSGLAIHRSATAGPHDPIDAQQTFDVNGAWTQRLGAFSIRHALSAHNVANDRVAYPEYVRGNLNEIEEAHGRTIRYTARFEWKQNGDASPRKMR